MPNIHKLEFLKTLENRFHKLHKLSDSQSQFIIGDDAARLYIRYSKVHSGGRTFFGLRAVDLRQLEGHNSFICFLLDDGSQPIFVPYADFEELFHSTEPAGDGQYKVQLVSNEGSREMYIARKGRFNVEGYVGFEFLTNNLDTKKLRTPNDFSHSQIQSLLAGIGHFKGYDVFLPKSDVGKLDWTQTKKFSLLSEIPKGFEEIRQVLSEIDVVWVAAGRNTIEGLYEVEHSTPVYSGLLRFNDMILTEPRISRFSIVSNDSRRDLFSRQINRPTFKKSGLTELVSFLEYENVFDWHTRLSRGKS